MPYHADATQAAIVEALRAAGCSVQLIRGENGQAGTPDLLVGREVPGTFMPRQRRNYLLEVKAAKGKLSEAQVRWHQAWRGQVAVVRTVAEALAAVGLVPLALTADRSRKMLGP